MAVYECTAGECGTHHDYRCCASCNEKEKCSNVCTSGNGKTPTCKSAKSVKEDNEI